MKVKEDIIICDIDGVVCDCSARIAQYSNYKALEEGDYNAFRASMSAYNSASVDEDIPILAGINLIESLFYVHNPQIVFLTSRGNESYENTYSWLREHIKFLPSVSDFSLIMRPEYFESSPGIFWREGEPQFCHVEFKKGEVLKLLDEYNVLYALDDYLPIVDMYHSLGIPSLHVKFPGVDCLSKAGMAGVSSSSS